MRAPAVALAVASLLLAACGEPEAEPLPTTEEMVEVCEVAEDCLVDMCGGVYPQLDVLNEQLIDDQLSDEELDAIQEQIDALSQQLRSCNDQCIWHYWGTNLSIDCNVQWSTVEEAECCAHVAASRAFGDQGPCTDHLLGPV